MTGCGRNYCPHCGEELIHRDHRAYYESASALGQIVWREGPSKLTVTDLDMAARKSLRGGSQLLRLIEQKQPRHKFEYGQEQTLRLLDAALGHCSLCADAADLRINPRSGVYVVRGLIAGATEGRRETRFGGPQRIEKLATGQVWEIQEHEQFFQFLDPEDLSRRRKR